ncbi:hypothetical protein JOE21_003686 [Desmospora profundinema]|uniref:Phosphatidate cytidylyltransferase n=1 Tax=Desmospora profundinema TaxID=1571184 RepID=A0ABU1IS79_9BACL|nr:hypothetical protein [Desmospora profundinema]
MNRILSVIMVITLTCAIFLEGRIYNVLFGLSLLAMGVYDVYKDWNNPKRRYMKIAFYVPLTIVIYYVVMYVMK